MDVLKTLFEQYSHSSVARVQPLQGQLGGSGRRIIRLASETFSAFGILYDVREENVAFLEFSRHFRRHGLPVPKIYAEDLSHGAYLEEDLGDRSVFVDYQGGRRGALQYDIASLLYDGKADLPQDLRQQLLDHYLDTLAGFIKLEREVFMQHYYAYVFVRLMQALGAYGFRGFYERKAHFLQSVPYALKNIRWLLHNVELPIALPALTGAFTNMLGVEKLQVLASGSEALTIRIFSFSFHQGLPKDETGNGGGFVFDARSVPNPGREEKFKELTGKDAPVMDYLNQLESTHQFLSNVTSLVESSVGAYQRRGFKNLMVSFGCTGGQHRSVYFAEQLAKQLRDRNGVEVVVRHLGLEKLGL